MPNIDANGTYVRRKFVAAWEKENEYNEHCDEDTGYTLR